MAVRERSKSLEELPSKHYQVTVENTKLKTQGNSPFDFKKYVVRANFFSCPRALSNSFLQACMGTETERIYHVTAAGLAQSVISTFVLNTLTPNKVLLFYQTLRFKTLFAALHPLGLRLYRRKILNAPIRTY